MWTTSELLFVSPVSPEVLVVLLPQVQACCSAIAFVSEVVALARDLVLPTHSRLLCCGATSALLLGSRVQAETLHLKCPLLVLVSASERCHVVARFRVQDRT